MVEIADCPMLRACIVNETAFRTLHTNPERAKKVMVARIAAVQYSTLPHAGMSRRARVRVERQPLGYARKCSSGVEELDSTFERPGWHAF